MPVLNRVQNVSNNALWADNVIKIVVNKKREFAVQLFEINIRGENLWLCS